MNEPTPTAQPSAASPSEPTQRYTLTTAICLIVGICIGSGIFFKSDNILVATGGNIALGVGMFLLAATTIIFGGLTLARVRGANQRARRPDRLRPGVPKSPHGHPHWLALHLLVPPGNLRRHQLGRRCLCLHDLGLPGDFYLQMGIGVAFLIACTVWNICWPTLSGYFQNLTTIAKALPLVAVGVLGLVFAHPVEQIAHDIATASNAGFGWLAAAAPIAFAFDGWSSAVSIAPELKDAKRNLPRALIAAPLIILALYLGYFLGLSCYLGPQAVIEAGDASFSLLFVRMFGEQAAALPNVIALVAVLGTANGMVLATLRMPFALALHNQIPGARVISRVNKTLRFPVASAGVALATALFWIAVHTVVTTLGLLPNGDISEVAVGLTMCILPVFYLFSLKESITPSTSAHGSVSARLRRAIAPALALVSSLAVGLSSISDPTRWPFVIADLAVLALAVWAMNRKAPAVQGD